MLAASRTFSGSYRQALQRLGQKELVQPIIAGEFGVKGGKDAVLIPDHHRNVVNVCQDLHLIVKDGFNRRGANERYV
jgi:hypothetical protein